MRLRATLLALSLAAFSAAGLAQNRAKNVILFIGDAGGLSTLNVASIKGYEAPQKLFLQRMPHIGLSDTSSTSSWVSDSAAGMTAIVTGRKTSNGTLSQTPDGVVLKTILEYAEANGLSTGVVSNVNIADATPAACYAHADSRKKFAEIFSQVWAPRFGDGVDVVFGGGRDRITASLKEKSLDLDEGLKKGRFGVYASVGEVPATAKKAAVVLDGANFKDTFKVDEAAEKAIQILSRNPKGYFLMVEWDLHPTQPERALETVVAFDRLIERTALKLASKDTLVIYAADHSFDFRMVRGKRGAPLSLPANAKESAAGKFDVNVGTSHTAEEVLVAAHGPGAERVKGFLPNTAIFQVMMAAYGWKPEVK